MSLNSILTLAALAGVVLFVVIFWVKSRGGASDDNDEELNTFGKIMDVVRMKMLELDKEESSSDDSDDKFRRENRRRARFKNANAGSVHGKDDAKIIVIDRIRAIIAESTAPNIVKKILGLDDSPPVENKFEILLYRYKKKYGKQALSELITKYEWDRLRKDEPYYIAPEDIHYAWEREEISLSDNEMFEVLAVLIFQRYKGFGVIDTIREMDIDGISGGVSGAVLPHAKKEQPTERRTEASIWITYHGKEIHMRFLTFSDEGEMRRITQALLSYGSKGSLTRNRGVMVCNSWDGARVTAVCPPASRSWTFFVRKFGYMGKPPEELIVTATNNGMLLVDTLRYLMQGEVSTALSGGQGSGKSTLMSSITRFIDPRYTIRTLEMSFELGLRDLYPDRNVTELQETQFVSASVLQDAMKKMNGMVSFAGEVATSEVAVRMIQFAKVASLFTMFTYHAEEP